MEYYTIIFQEKNLSKFVAVKNFIKKVYSIDTEIIRVKLIEDHKKNSKYIAVNHIESKYAKYFLSVYEENQYLYWITSYENILLDTNDAQSAVFLGETFYFSNIIKILKMDYSNG